MELRECIFKKTRIWSIWDVLPYRWSLYYYDYIKPIFKPRHDRIRKAIPRTWCDISQLIVDVNFEFVKSFYEEEYKDGVVDWKATEPHRLFEEWLIDVYRYITVERPILQNRLENSYSAINTSFMDRFKETVDDNGNRVYVLVDDGIPYEVKYKDVIHYENLINKKDTEYLKQIVEKRESFWT